MSLILNIDTALETARISLSKDGILLDADNNNEKKDHAAWLHVAVKKLMKLTGFRMEQLNAISITIGPGSYTGLRVGLSAAKGYCYALKIPLIAINTLELAAYSVRDEAIDLICPMIDARRMEVYTAVYDKNLIEKIAPVAMILHINSFESLLSVHKILFCGNGANKFRTMANHTNAAFTELGGNAYAQSALANISYKEKKFADIAYLEPLYLKDFHSST